MMLCQQISRNSQTICCAIRSISTSCRVCASHYDVLGLTPKATQTDIKTAYYELSKVYHPDKSTDEASAKHFRAITEAYKILGNIKLKKMYDKGLSVGRENKTRMDYQPEPEPTDPELKFYKSRMKHHHVTPFKDGSPIYDFDSWSKHHYGNTFKKSQYEKEASALFREKRKYKNESHHRDAMMLGILIVSMTFIFIIMGQSDYDKVHSTSKETNESSE